MKGGKNLEDHNIVDLYWFRDENAISETDKKYGSYCNTIANNILYNLEDDDALHIGGRFGDGIGFGEVDISARVVAQQVGQRHDAQLLEPLSGLGANALQVAHRRIRGEGGMVFGGHRHQLLCKVV